MMGLGAGGGLGAEGQGGWGPRGWGRMGKAGRGEPGGPKRRCPRFVGKPGQTRGMGRAGCMRKPREGAQVRGAGRGWGLRYWGRGGLRSVGFLGMGPRPLEHQAGRKQHVPTAATGRFAPPTTHPALSPPQDRAAQPPHFPVTTPQNFPRCSPAGQSPGQLHLRAGGVEQSAELTWPWAGRGPAGVQECVCAGGEAGLRGAVAGWGQGRAGKGSAAATQPHSTALGGCGGCRDLCTGRTGVQGERGSTGRARTQRRASSCVQRAHLCTCTRAAQGAGVCTH